MDLRIPGPTHADNTRVDSIEPYVWDVGSVSYLGGLSQWLADFTALDAADQIATLVMTDEAAPPGVGDVALVGTTRAAIRTRGVVGVSVRLAGVASATIRTLGSVGAPERLMGVVRAGIRTRGAVSLSAGMAPLAGITRGTIRARGILRAELPAGAYFTADGDVLDEICWLRYGREDAVPAVLAANPRLADAGPVLPAGVLIVLRDLPRASRALPAERLWDVAPPSVALPERERRDVRLGGSFRAAMRVTR